MECSLSFLQEFSGLNQGTDVSTCVDICLESLCSLKENLLVAKSFPPSREE